MMRCLVGAALALSLLGTAAAKELPAGDSQVCASLTPSEASKLLGGKPDIIDADGPDGALYCAWTIDNGIVLQNLLSVTLIDGPALGGLDAPGYFSAARQFEIAAGGSDAAGIGDAAVAARLSDGSLRVLVRAGAWIGIIEGPGLPDATVLEASRLAASRFASVQHPLSHPAMPSGCALMSLADAGAALGRFPFISISDTKETQTACIWMAGTGANLMVFVREKADLGGQAPADYIKSAAQNGQVSQSVDGLNIGEEAFISPADPKGGYFVLMVLQHDRIAILSGLGMSKNGAVQAGKAVAGRL